MTRLIISIIFLSLLYWACSGTSKKLTENLPSKQIPPKTSNTNGNTQNPKTGNPDDYHYLVHCVFNEKTVKFTKYEKGIGDAPLIVIPSAGIFLAIFQKGNLAFFQEFFDPLGGQINTGLTVLTFPNWVTDSTKTSPIDIGIYRTKEYQIDFKSRINTLQSMQEAIQNGAFEKAYSINAFELSNFLSD